MATEQTDQTQGTPAEGEQTLSPEVLALAEKGRTGSAAPPEFRPQDAGKPQRPDTVPEKFWDAEKGVVNQDALLKSYLELEKTRGAAPEVTETPEAKAAREAAEALANETPEQKEAREAEEKAKETPAPEGDNPVTSAITAAQEAYAANNGELPAETRKALVDAGIPEAAIDAHLSAVKAEEAALRVTAAEAADGLDVDELFGWAAENLEQEEIVLLNQGLANPKTMAKTVAGLARDFRDANPTEGRLSRVPGGSNYGDVYNDKNQFIADLAAADKSGDRNARAAAVQKLSRSKKAGTIKEVTPRSGPYRN